ncbi:glycerophosphodiester phosphodiesterase family protein [Dickeya dadantii]|uniref:glycerophosphodiester phosphodiesterase family protein n=1 Tax=Dickeya dadantii TaxID=204038 RepID=UPI000980A435|nr:glycerophosphodiester phosphodiesterase family protein [Dickeya dadantii]UAY95473.1 hypothetical protein KTF62_16910 [Dickeya dadantii]
MKTTLKLHLVRYVIFAILFFPFLSQVNAANYNPELVMYALGHHNPNLKIITAHRGLYGAGCPENTACAIRATANQGIESVEIDVKESKNGTVWPFHDETVGRSTNYTYNGNMFNPFIYSRVNSMANPPVADLSDEQLYRLKWRDPSGAVSGYWVDDLKATLNNVKTLIPNVVVILDIKTTTAVRRCAEIINELGMGSSVLLKFSVRLFPPALIKSATGGFRFAPTVYMGDLDSIYANYRYITYSPASAVAGYLQEYAVQEGFTYYEVGVKEFSEDEYIPGGGIWSAHGSLAQIINILARNGHAIGNFAPVTEHTPDARSRATGFYDSFGACCVSLTKYLTRTQHFGTELRDDRPYIDAQVYLFDNILTDAAARAVSIAEKRGYRRELYKLIR